MDPKACLLEAIDLFVSGQYEDCAEHVADYVSWRLGGGFQPSQGDDTAGKLIVALGKAAETSKAAFDQLGASIAAL